MPVTGGEPAPHISTVPEAFRALFHEFDDTVDPGDFSIFRIKLGDLGSWQDADLFRTRMAETLGVAGWFSRDRSLFSEVRAQNDPVDRAFGRFTIPTVETESAPGFMRRIIENGEVKYERIATPEKLYQALATFQVDTPEVEEGLIDRYRMSGAIRRPEMIESAVRQFNERVNISKLNTTTLDIETVGVSSNTVPWQIAYRDRRNGVVGEMQNLLFDQTRMNEGYWEIEGRQVQFPEYYRWALDQQGDEAAHALEFIDEARFGEKLGGLARSIAESDLVVGQNLEHDVGYIIKMFQNTPEFKSGTGETFEVMQRAIMKLSTPEAIYDTLLQLTMHLSDIGIATELTDKGKFTPRSITNILYESNALRLLAEDRGMELGEFLQSGLHNATVDVEITDWLGQLTANDRLLVPERLSDEYRDLIRGTSFNLFKESPSGRSHVMEQVYRNRDINLFSTERATAYQLEDQMFKAGMFDDWASSILTEDGLVQSGKSVLDGFSEMRAAAVAANLPFAGISHYDRLLTTLLASTNSGPLTTMRQAAGDVLQTAAFVTHDKIRVVGKSKGIVGIPRSLLERAEATADVVDPTRSVLGTHFGAALDKSGVRALQEARLSPFEYRKGAFDFALAADIFEDQFDVARFTSYLRRLVESADEATQEYAKSIGLTQQNLGEITEALRKTGLRYGVQVGVMEADKSGSQAAARAAYGLMSELDATTDRSRMTARVPLFHLSDVPGTDGGIIGAGPAHFVEALYDQNPDIQAQHRRASTLAGGALGEGSQDQILAGVRQVQSANWAARQDSTLVHAAGLQRRMGGDIVGRAYRASRNLTGNLPRNLGIAALAGLGYYAYSKNQEQDFYDETFAFQGYEAPDFHPAQQRQNEAPPLINPYQQRQPENPLATATVVQELDARRIGHTQMGPSKYDHLF